MKKYSLGSKILAVAFATLFLIGLGISIFVTGTMASLSVYDHKNFEDWHIERYQGVAADISHYLIRAYSASMSNCPVWVQNQTDYWHETLDSVRQSWQGAWNFQVLRNGNLLWEDNSAQIHNAHAFTFMETVSYPVMDDDSTYIIEDNVTGEKVKIAIRQIPGYQVTVTIDMNSMPHRTVLPTQQAEEAFNLRYLPVVMIFVFLGLFAAAFVYLMLSAGRKPDSLERKPAALNRIPLDIYGVFLVLGANVGTLISLNLSSILWRTGGVNGLYILFLCLDVVITALLPIGFFMALAAQAKCKMVWRNSVIGRCWKYIWKGIRFVFRVIGKLFALLPVIWEWLLIAFGLALCGALSIAWFFTVYQPIVIILWLLLCTIVTAYGAWCFGTIRKGIQRMTKGDLTQQISTNKLFGAFKAMAKELNTLQDAAHLSAQKQLRSERMKAELITNVSHDIKTPLTSLINYVDLLQKPHTEEEGAQYLEVLARQSVQMKKLLDDLMEMSKATTGNLSVVLESLDAVEAMNQALGEYADKLAYAHLTPVLDVPETPVPMIADGKLTWRVLGNLMSNVIKYALPGTRVYLSVKQDGDSVILSVKNISKEPLNIDADELMERFVRGDASRNTEGSGLGLNIAQTLMTLQRGKLALTVDGDLFKAELILPKA